MDGLALFSGGKSAKLGSVHLLAEYHEKSMRRSLPEKPRWPRSKSGAPHGEKGCRTTLSTFASPACADLIAWPLKCPTSDKRGSRRSRKRLTSCRARPKCLEPVIS